jgi:hypothetical protein
MNFRSSFALLPCLLLVNCASIISKTQYPVTFSSNPSGATVKVKNQEGVLVHQATTPATVTLSSRGGYFKPAKYEVEFNKKGYPIQTMEVTATLDGWYFGNIVFGGLIGLVIVDPATGAMWRLEDKVDANLKPIAMLHTGEGKQLKIVDRKTVPTELASKLIAMN